MPPICLSRSLQGALHSFCVGIEMIKIFRFKWFSIVCFFFLFFFFFYSAVRLMHKKGCSEGLWTFLKVMELWKRNVYIDLNGKRQKRKDIADVWWLGLFKALSFHFAWELKWSKSFVLSDLASYFFRLSGWCIKKAVQKVCGFFLKVLLFGTGTFTLNWMENDKIWRISK